MKLLLDENLPKRLKLDLTEFDVSTVAENGWAGKKNGELMKLMTDNNIDALLTFDKNLQYQQNFKKYNVSILVLTAKDNTYKTLSELMPKVKESVKSGLNTGVEIVSK